VDIHRRELRLGIDQRHEIGHPQDLYAFEPAESKERPIASDDIPRSGRDRTFENPIVVRVLRNRIYISARARAEM